MEKRGKQPAKYESRPMFMTSAAAKIKVAGWSPVSFYRLSPIPLALTVGHRRKGVVAPRAVFLLLDLYQLILFLRHFRGPYQNTGLAPGSVYGNKATANSNAIMVGIGYDDMMVTAARSIRQPGNEVLLGS